MGKSPQQKYSIREDLIAVDGVLGLISKPKEARKKKLTLHDGLVNGALASLEYKHKCGIELNINEAIKSTLATFQFIDHMKGAYTYSCCFAQMVVCDVLRHIDEKYGKEFKKEVPSFWYLVGETVPPPLFLQLIDPERRGWVCTPQERKECGIEDMCMQENQKCGTNITYTDQSAISKVTSNGSQIVISPQPVHA